jgi:polysaccharide deacetylase family protein (PEP-CTERM system associated)
MINAMTIDVEDYYQVSAFEANVRFEDWSSYESRVEKNTQHILDLFDECATKATFFVLGWIAERKAELVRVIEQRGHEVASHGYAHQRIYTQTPSQFREETRKSKRILEDIIGKSIYGYRAASYSITRDSLWALDILQEEGFAYDSSIFPIRHDRYGIPDHPRFCHIHRRQGGSGLVEFPISTVQLGGMNLPMGGGGYFRIFPYGFTRWGIRRLNNTEHQAAVFYLHPWEIDPTQPPLQGSRLSRFRHYRNLEKTESRLCQLLHDFRFAPMVDVLRERGFFCEDVSLTFS